MENCRNLSFNYHEIPSISVLLWLDSYVKRWDILSSFLKYSIVLFIPVITETYNRRKIEPPHDKTNKTACVPSEDSDQSGLPHSLIRVFAAQADLSPCWAHMPFCCFCREAAPRFFGFFSYSIKIKFCSEVLVHVLSPVTDNCHSWISSRKKMAISTNVMWLS